VPHLGTGSALSRVSLQLGGNHWPVGDHLYPPGACSKKGLTIVTRGPVGSFHDRDSGSRDLARLEQLRREWLA
jgi:hypothetical protein